MIRRPALLLLSGIAVIVLYITSGCSNPTNPTPAPDSNRILIAEQEKDGYKISVYSLTQRLTMGYNQVFAVISKDDNVVRKARVTFSTHMDMGSPGMAHGCPIDQPVSENADQYGAFGGALIFVMASETAWTLTVKAEGMDGADVEANLTVPVGMTSNLKVVKVGDKRVVISLIPPAKWSVGMNDAVFRLHTKDQAFVFPELNGATMVIDPEMPSMGHGSPGNVNPVEHPQGWYSGKVNLTMSGEWVINVNVTLPGGDGVATAQFPLTVQ